MTTPQRKVSSDDESLHYEDNSDLETTINKLRQLLSERSNEDSTSNSMDESSNQNEDVSQELTISDFKVSVEDFEDEQRLIINFNKKEYGDVDVLIQNQVIKKLDEVEELEERLRLHSLYPNDSSQEVRHSLTLSN